MPRDGVVVVTSSATDTHATSSSATPPQRFVCLRSFGGLTVIQVNTADREVRVPCDQGGVRLEKLANFPDKKSRIRTGGPRGATVRNLRRPFSQRDLFFVRSSDGDNIYLPDFSCAIWRIVVRPYPGCIVHCLPKTVMNR